MAIPEATQDHYQTMQALQIVAIKSGRRAWDKIDPRFLSESWRHAIVTATPAVTAIQARAAFEGSTYGAMTLAEQGQYVAPSVFVDAEAFKGYASDGRSLDGLLYRPIVETKARIGQGASTESALASGRSALDMILMTQIADVARQASGADIAARSGVGYVRMLNPPSCDRCTVQAGKWFRWNQGFLRHPRCDCVHVASRAGSLRGALDEGLIDDPYKAFNDLSAGNQDRIYGKANAAAIRDGADMRQVVNARRGMSVNGLFTTEGTTVQGNAANLLKARQRRMTPELIYKQAQTREEALALLKQHG